MTILDTLGNPKLFGRHFEGESWAWWRVFLAALFGQPIEGDDLIEKCYGHLQNVRDRSPVVTYRKTRVIEFPAERAASC